MDEENKQLADLILPGRWLLKLKMLAV